MGRGRGVHLTLAVPSELVRLQASIGLSSYCAQSGMRPQILNELGDTHQGAEKVWVPEDVSQHLEKLEILHALQRFRFFSTFGFALISVYCIRRAVSGKLGPSQTLFDSQHIEVPG